jgi:hypothetical protein
MLKARERTLFDRYVLTKEVKLDSDRFLETLEEVRLAPIAPRMFVRESEEPLPGSYLVIEGNYRAVAHAYIGRQLRIFPIRSPREIDLLLKDDTVGKQLPFRESVLVAARTERGAILDEALISAARRFKFRTAHDLALAYHSLVRGRSVLTPDTGSMPTTDTEERRFAELFPWMEHDTRKIDHVFLSKRLSKCLRENRVARWSQLASLTPTDLYAWDRMGHKSISLLLKCAEEQSYQIPLEVFSGRKSLPTNGVSQVKATQIVAEPDDATAIAQSPIGALQTAILTLSRYATFFSKTKTLGHILEVAENDLPYEVALAAKQLRELDLTSVIPDSSSDTNLGSLVDAFFQEFSKQEMDIFFARLNPGKLTLHDIGLQWGLTRERVRQLDANSHERIEQLLDSQRYMPVRWVSELLRARIGTGFPAECAQLRDLILDFIPRLSGMRKERIHKLLLFIAGPYEFDSETQWYYLDPVPNPRIYESCTNRFGVVNSNELTDILTASGMKSEFVHAWMVEVAKLKEIEGCYVQWEGSIADKATTLLYCCGGSRTIEQIVEAIDEGYSLKYAQQCLYADRRIVKMNDHEVDLRFRDAKRAGKKSV